MMNVTDGIPGMTGDPTGSSNWTSAAPPPPAISGHAAALNLMWKIFLPFILLLGTFGNVATIIVMRRIKDENTSQRTFLVALAASDLSLLYTVVFSKWVRNVFGVDLMVLHGLSCKLMMWLIYATNTVSTWLITSVTVQRTLAIKWPHKIRLMCTTRRTWIVIAGVVLVGSGCHSHFLFGMDLDEKNMCEFVGFAGYFDFYLEIWLAADMLISSVIPTVFLLICDVILSLTLFEASRKMQSSAAQVGSNADSSENEKGSNRRKAASKTTVMILTVSSAFLVLTLPLCLLFLVRWFVMYLMSNDMWDILLAVTLSLWYLNFTVNFLLYCLTGTKFRNEFLSLIGWPINSDASSTVGRKTALDFK